MMIRWLPLALVLSGLVWLGPSHWIENAATEPRIKASLLVNKDIAGNRDSGLTPYQERLMGRYAPSYPTAVVRQPPKNWNIAPLKRRGILQNVAVFLPAVPILAWAVLFALEGRKRG